MFRSICRFLIKKIKAVTKHKPKRAARNDAVMHAASEQSDPAVGSGGNGIKVVFGEIVVVWGFI